MNKWKIGKQKIDRSHKVSTSGNNLYQYRG